MRGDVQKEKMSEVFLLILGPRFQHGPADNPVAAQGSLPGLTSALRRLYPSDGAPAFC